MSDDTLKKTSEQDLELVVAGCGWAYIQGEVAEPGSIQDPRDTGTGPMTVESQTQQPA